jgi:CRP/FNR family transcriptional regulator, cyclic AMP receptor protein
MNIIDILAATEIFDTFTQMQLELVATFCEPVTCRQGDILMREYEHSQALYVIARGGVEIYVSPEVMSQDNQRDFEPTKVAELSQGQVVGEIALVDEGTRSATVRVSQPETVLLKIARQRLMLLCDTYPELGYKLMRNLAGDLAFKIRSTDLTVRQLQLLLTQSKKSSG